MPRRAPYLLLLALAMALVAGCNAEQRAEVARQLQATQHTLASLREQREEVQRAIQGASGAEAEELRAKLRGLDDRIGRGLELAERLAEAGKRLAEADDVLGQAGELVRMAAPFIPPPFAGIAQLLALGLTAAAAVRSGRQAAAGAEVVRAIEATQAINPEVRATLKERMPPSGKKFVKRVIGH